MAGVRSSLCDVGGVPPIHLGVNCVIFGKFVLDSTHGLPLGGYRTAPTVDDTDRGYTGHLHTDGIGLIYMNARFYVGANGRISHN